MSIDTRFGVRFFALEALLVVCFAGCGGGAPTRPTADGGTGGTTGSGGRTGGNTGGSSGSGTGGMGDGGTGGAAGAAGGAGSGGSAGDAGAIDAPGAMDGNNPPEVSPEGPSCGAVGQACCSGNSCSGDLSCLDGVTCTCAKTLFGQYLLRTDGKLLLEYDPPSTAQTPVVDATTGLPLANVTAASGGYAHGCAVQGTSKKALCWRTVANGNASGQLGNGVEDTTGPLFRATEVLVAANQPLTNVIGVAVSPPVNLYPGTSCAVTQSGGFYCWGNLTWLVNDFGVNPMPLNSTYAVPITTDGVTPLTGVLQGSITGVSACVIVQGSGSKELWCWGENRFGQLATGDQTPRRYPTKVAGVTDPRKVVIQGVSGGTGCVVDGMNVRCWGYSAQGQTGTGMTGTVLAPSLVTLMGGMTALGGIVDISAGASANYPGVTCALTATHTVLCWGYSGFQAYPAAYNVTNVSALGAVDGFVNSDKVRVLTSDGIYHMGNVTRAPNCGLLQ